MKTKGFRKSVITRSNHSKVNAKKDSKIFEVFFVLFFLRFQIINDGKINGNKPLMCKSPNQLLPYTNVSMV